MVSVALDEDVIDRVREAVSAASSVDEVVERIAGHLPEELAVSRVGFRVYDPEHDFVVVAGVWSKQPTQLKAGIAYPIVSSLGESFSSVVKARTCSMRVVGMDPIAPPVLQDILAAEGNASGVLIPVPQGPDVAGVLAIFSARSDAFQVGAASFFDRLGAELSGPLLSHVAL
jgi:hypothetical protein